MTRMWLSRANLEVPEIDKLQVQSLPAVVAGKHQLVGNWDIQCIRRSTCQGLVQGVHIHMPRNLVGTHSIHRSIGPDLTEPWQTEHKAVLKYKVI